MTAIFGIHSNIRFTKLCLQTFYLIDALANKNFCSFYDGLVNHIVIYYMSHRLCVTINLQDQRIYTLENRHKDKDSFFESHVPIYSMRRLSFTFVSSSGQ